LIVKVFVQTLVLVVLLLFPNAGGLLVCGAEARFPSRFRAHGA
jgi:hypothetical protein